jgi:hypothetical protein
MNIGMNQYVQETLRSNFLCHKYVCIKSQSHLFEYLNALEEDQYSEVIVLEELICLNGESKDSVMSILAKQIKWIHFGSMTTFQSHDLPKNFRKSTKPFISKDLVELLNNFEVDLDNSLKSNNEVVPRADISPGLGIAKGQKKLKILIIDDNPTILKVSEFLFGSLTGVSI